MTFIHRTAPLAIPAIGALFLSACAAGDSGPTPELPDVSAVTFVGEVTNSLFPLPVGATWTYVAEGPEGTERIEIRVLDPAVTSKTVHGVVATVVEDVVYLNDDVIEYTQDWYAQDSDGNVWYLGEDTCEFEPGTYDPNQTDCAHPVGAWEWGVDGALPGILMRADPQVDGKPYYQEFYEGEAQDVGEVVAVGLSVSVAAGSFSGCVKTHDTSTLDPDLSEYKYYCAGVGSVKIEEPDVTEELTMFVLPP
jgi:hypothetical protein